MTLSPHKCCLRLVVGLFVFTLLGMYAPTSRSVESQGRNAAPVARAGGPYRWSAGQPIQFDGTESSDAEGGIAGYSWTFGDGSTGSGAIVSHAYSSAGTYTATLTVVDSNGATGSDSTTVTVEPPASTHGAAWTSVVNALADGNDLSKPTTSAAAWDAGAVSQHVVPGSAGYVDFTISDQGPLFVAGLGYDNSGTSADDVEFALRFEGLTVQALDRGVSTGLQLLAEPGDRFRVSIESGVARYARNGRLLAEIGALRRLAVWPVETEPDVDWELVALADVDGDGDGDIIWHHATLGSVRVWLMDGTAHTATVDLGAEPDTDWILVSAGDFDRNGTADLLWHNRVTGGVRAWLLANGVPPVVVGLGQEPDGSWSARALGDFNQDGYLDVLWRHAATGALRTWLMQGTSQVGVLDLPTEPDLGWKVVGAGDLNHDGEADIIWSNTQAKTKGWYMHLERLLAATGLLPQPTYPDWAAVALGDLDGDGRADLVWRNMSSGAVEVWSLDGTTPGGLQADAALFSPGAAVLDTRLSGTPNVAPLADAGGTYLWTAGDPITFDASASVDPDGTSLASYSWDFGDESVGSGVQPTHAYGSPGDYIATLTVTDHEGASASTTAVVRVQPAYPQQPAVWAHRVGVQVIGSTLIKTAADGWNAGASGHHRLTSGDGYVEFQGGIASHRMAGLGTLDSSPHYNDIDFALHLMADGTLRAFESGVLRGIVGHYQSADRLRVVVDRGAIVYVKNGRVLATGTNAFVYPLSLDTSLFSANAYLSGGVTAGEHVELHNSTPDVTVATADCQAPCTATFTATASDPDADPLSYAWSACAAGQSGVVATCAIGTVTAVTATVTVTDELGASASASATAHGLDAPPSVTIEGPSSCHPACTLTFTASASDPNGDPLTLSWGDCAAGQSGFSATCSFTSMSVPGGGVLLDTPVLDWVATTFVALDGYAGSPGACDEPSDVGSASCRAAADRYCRSLPGHAGGFGPVEYDATSAWVRCIGGGFGEQRWTTWTTLSQQHSACSGAAAATTPACAAAAHRFCVTQGFGSGFGPVEFNGTDTMVFCTSSAVSRVLVAPLTQVPDCGGGASTSAACLTAADGYCGDAGYGGGFGAVEITQTSATLACLPSSQTHVDATVSVVADDGRGGTASAASTIRLTNARPGVHVMAVGGGCHVPCTATFTATAGDADGDPLTYEWGDCAVGQTGPVVTCTMFQAGTVQATVVVRDSLGATAAASGQASGSNAAPTVSISGETACHPPCLAQLSATASDPDNDPLELTWGGCTLGQVGPEATCSLPSIRVDGSPPVQQPIAEPVDVPFTTLDTYVAPTYTCSQFTWSQGGCRIAANRYCAAQPGYSGGLAPVEHDASNAKVVCFGNEFSDRIVTTWATLAQYYDFCGAGAYQSPACRVAVDWFCQDQGYGAGAGPLEGIGDTQVIVVCAAAVVTRSMAATFAQLNEYVANEFPPESLCANSSSGSVACRVAVNRHCRELGYGGGIGPATAGNGVAQFYCMPDDVTVGIAEASVTADDGRGGVATAATSVLALDEWPAGLSVTATPSSCAAPCDVTFRASAVDPDNDPLAFAWSGCALGKAGSSVVCHARQPGVLSASVTAGDGLGGTTQGTAQAVIQPAGHNLTPVSKPGGPYRIVAGHPLTLDGRASYDLDGVIAQASWNFGDGASGIGLVIVHTYAAAGTYTASLQVRDDYDASHTAQAQVVVTSEDDPDGDGLTNTQEATLGSDPNNADTNGDGVPDGAAFALGLSLTDLDMDDDGLNNAVELALGTDPFRSDTDGDGHGDAQDAFPLDPLLWDATPDPGDTTWPLITLQKPEAAQPLP